VVTATRSATRADQLVSDLVVVDRTTIENAAERTLPELLARSAGLQFSANGGPGGVSSVYVRGSEARHTVLLIDGVRYGSVTLGTPIWDNLPLELIERIEVLKGPASSLYGSDAVGGVVQVFTRQGTPGWHPQAMVSAGSYGRVQLGSGFSGGQGPWRYALGVQHTQMQGFSATDAAVPYGDYNPDRDGFTQDALHASATWQFSRGWKLDASTVYADGLARFDDGPGRDARAALRTHTQSLGVQGEWAPGWASSLRWSQSQDSNNAIVAAYGGYYTSRQRQWSWQNDLVTPLGTALLGVEQLQQQADASVAYTVAQRRIQSVFAGLHGQAGAHRWQFNLRHDGNSQFGGSDTGFLGYGYTLSPAWQVQASRGSSFVAPSFNQLYYPGYSNPLLQPERGHNTEFGLAWQDGAHHVKLVHFDNRIRGFITSTMLPINIAQARIQGSSLSYDGAVGAWGVRASLDALNPRDELNQPCSPGAAATRPCWRWTTMPVAGRGAPACCTPARALTTVPTPRCWRPTPR